MSRFVPKEPEATAFVPVAYIRTDYPEKFGIPRQSGRVPAPGRIVFYPAFRDAEALREIEGFSHLWLLFDFSESHRKKWSPTVRPPRLGGNKRVGVFASRSPFRPNPIGLSSVRLLGVENTKEFGATLLVSGADLLDGTPIFDIKPYLPFTDCHTDAVGGYSESEKNHKLAVHCNTEFLSRFPADKLDLLTLTLADDPRPSYQDDPDRIYSMKFAGYDVHFSVKENALTVLSCDKL